MCRERKSARRLMSIAVFFVFCILDMMLMLWEGMRQRAVGAHNLNKDSSRSHSMLTFYLESEEMIDDEPCVKFGKIAFVDLAGTERLKDTQNGEVRSLRFRALLRRRRSSFVPDRLFVRDRQPQRRSNRKPL